MPNLTLGGVVLGLRSKPYDFTDRETGQQNKGVSHRLFLWDDAVTEPIEIVVPQDRLGLLNDLSQGLDVQINVEPRASQNRIQYRFDSVAALGGQAFTVAKKAA